MELSGRLTIRDPVDNIFFKKRTKNVSKKQTSWPRYLSKPPCHGLSSLYQLFTIVVTHNYSYCWEKEISVKNSKVREKLTKRCYHGRRSHKKMLIFFLVHSQLMQKIDIHHTS